MEKRKYTHIKEGLQGIEAIMAAGKSHKEVGEHFGLAADHPVRNLLKQERRRQKKADAGILPSAKGRPRKDGSLG